MLAHFIPSMRTVSRSIIINMSLKVWVSIITVGLLAVILFAARNEIIHAWELLGSVNLWVLSLIIPMQVIVYFIAGEMMFSYLRDKKVIGHINIATQARMALEMNFVNHVLPSAGVSGVSYMTWRLHKYGISPGRATMAQLVRFVASFAAFIVLLVIALLVITIDGDINRWMILLSSIIVFAMAGGTVLAVYLISSPMRGHAAVKWVARVINRILRLVGAGQSGGIDASRAEKFFDDLHTDYLELKKDKRILLKPFLWGLLFTIGDVLLYVITFWALGSPVNPAPILIAYGLATFAASFVVTPGGTGAFEAIMVSFLAIAGITAGTAIAGIVLTRVILLLGTIGLGYFFYQHALLKYGKSKHQA